MLSTCSFNKVIANRDRPKLPITMPDSKDETRESNIRIIRGPLVKSKNSKLDLITGLNRRLDRIGFHCQIGLNDTVVVEESRNGGTESIRLMQLMNPPPSTILNPTGYTLVVKLSFSCPVHIKWAFATISQLPKLQYVEFRTGCFDKVVTLANEYIHFEIRECPSVRQLIVRTNPLKPLESGTNEEMNRVVGQVGMVEIVNAILDYSLRYFKNLVKGDMHLPLGTNLGRFLDQIPKFKNAGKAKIDYNAGICIFSTFDGILTIPASSAADKHTGTGRLDQPQNDVDQSTSIPHSSDIMRRQTSASQLQKFSPSEAQAKNLNGSRTSIHGKGYVKPDSSRIIKAVTPQTAPLSVTVHSIDTYVQAFASVNSPDSAISIKSNQSCVSTTSNEMILLGADKTNLDEKQREGGTGEMNKTRSNLVDYSNSNSSNVTPTSGHSGFQDSLNNDNFEGEGELVIGDTPGSLVVHSDSDDDIKIVYEEKPSHNGSLRNSSSSTQDHSCNNNESNHNLGTNFRRRQSSPDYSTTFGDLFERKRPKKQI